MGKTIRTIYSGVIVIFLSACADQRSALNPAGEEAQSVYILFLTMAVGAAVIWLIVISLVIHAFRASRRRHQREASQALILWGGAVFPSIVLLLLLVYTLWLMPNIRPWFDEAENRPRIEITGEQYWWRIRYLDSGGALLFETANELRLPLGEPTAFSLLARDVIHSFWIPALGGKMDMIPGRINRLALTPTRPGIYRGPCAEFCGTSHALMNVTAKVVEKQEFEVWLAARRTRSAPERSDGARLFVRHGCPACHAVDGMAEARGAIGPNLTALGERLTIGAGTLKNTKENLALFIRDPAAIKPGATMPAFDMLPPAEIDAIAAWLGGLE
ncbi:MAG: Cytochrome c oxidase, subunit [Rhizobium sp.]|nr:Cytochrome c oxidase, subunit [Rhizobium sp.]